VSTANSNTAIVIAETGLELLDDKTCVETISSVGDLQVGQIVSEKPHHLLHANCFKRDTEDWSFTKAYLSQTMD
jgi:hypothetical protein